MVRISEIRVEHTQNTIGLGVAKPRLSWDFDDLESEQVAYAVEATYAGEHTVESRRIEDADRVLRPWPFAPLSSRQRVRVRLMVWTADGQRSAWSDPLIIEAGLLQPSDWQAEFVSPSPAAAPSIDDRPGYLLRARFDIPAGDITRVRLYASAHGVYSLEANGTPIGDEELAPGWTSYAHRLRYQTYDLAPYVAEGRNTLGAWLADGWYRGRLGFNGGRWDNYGSDVALLAQLEITFRDGTVTTLRPEGEWQWAPSAITSSGLYDGETFDARRLNSEWSTNSADEVGWKSCIVVATSTAALVAPSGPPVRVIETLDPVAIERRPDGRILLDFGQNITGRLRIRVDGQSGDVVRLHHAEVLENGELATRPLRGAPSIDAYTLRGGGESWAPRFTFHGFRYAEVEGWPGTLQPGDVVAEVLHSDMERSGWFSSSHPQLDRLHENVVWSMRDNFLDLPTDCPQRDERLGWTGDIQVFGPTATFLYHSVGTLTSWLDDVAAEQRQYGTVPNYVPWIECGFPLEPTAAWGDVVAILPWTIYQRVGDTAVLDRQFDSMYEWVTQVAELTGGSGLWAEGFQLGDWLDPTAPPDAPDAAQTDRYLVSTAYHAHSSRIAHRVAALLGRDAQREELKRISESAVAAFRREFVAPSGRLVSDSETAYALAIVFDLLESDSQVRHAGKRLAELVEESDYRIQTGFVGTPIVCDALAATGHHDVAYHLLLQTELPSWLYPITMGATTIWERWDSMLPDGSINPGEMTSFNHYSLGAVADYLHRVVAGLAPAAPGYRELLLEPHPGGGLTRAQARHLTPYGAAECSWERTGDELTVNALVPHGATALVRLPHRPEFRVGAGTHQWTVPFRPVEQDPPRKRRINIHNPEEREVLTVEARPTHRSQ